MEIRLRAVLYLRLSKEDLDKANAGDDSASIVNQRLLLTEYALSQGWAIVDTYIDDDYSGLYDDRPEFDRLIRDSRLGKFDIVLCKSQSRFTRNMEHLEKYLHHDFLLLGIRFIGLVDGVDTNVEGNKKTRQIYGLTNEWYCEDLSKNIKSVFRQKMRAGQFLGSFAPYGYLRDPEDGHRFIVDEYAAKVVNLIYDLTIEGYGALSISHILEDRRIDSPTVYKKKQGNYANVKADEFSVKYNFWSTTTINRILANDTYLGHLTQGRWEKISYKDKKVKENPRDKWIVVKNHHEPIISQEKFDKVRRIKVGRRRTGTAGKVHKFAGKIRCADCGSTLIKSGYTNDKMEDWNLRCQLANKSRKKLCTNHLIRASVIENAVLENIQVLVKRVLENKDRKD
ncbi:MAG: recombinase family protein, partial [Lachnospiraceae bacterium]|nr:recombinase family protein [Lachnospiraceae bacterium]